MRRPSGAHFSAFSSGSRRQWLSGGTLQRYRLELVPARVAVTQEKLEPTAEQLVGIVDGRSDIALWLPGPSARYSTVPGAVEAIDRVSSRKDMLGWLIHQVGNDEGVVSVDDTDGAILHPERVRGIATMSEGVHVRDALGRVGKYALASFWMNEAGIGLNTSAVAFALLHEVPYRVLRDPTRVFASLDGPVDPFSDDDVPLDPSAAFAAEGELWVGAEQLDGTRQQTADGITVATTTKLYRPRQSRQLQPD